MNDEDDAVRSFRALHLDEAGATEREEGVAHEEPLEIQVNGASLAVLMRTPGHDADLVRGFLLTERVVQHVDDIESIRHCTAVPHLDAEDNVMQVRLPSHVPFDLERFRRHMFASSSCGVCGKATLDNACAVAAPLVDEVKVSARVLASLPAQLRAAQDAFSRSGGLHAAGLFTATGDVVVVREDVGRHNAVDKVVGHAAACAVDTKSCVLLVSGRVSFELVQKAAAARIPLVAGISAPTSLAVRMARALHITLVGFLRGASMNVYAAEERLTSTP
jgi:FdhD protein